MKGLAASEIVGVFTRDQHEWEVCPTGEADEQSRTANILYAEGDLALRRVTTQTLTTATLQKPFTPGELIQIVGNVLRAAPRARPGGDLFLTATAQNFRHITPYRHWGINE